MGPLLRSRGIHILGNVCNWSAQPHAARPGGPSADWYNDTPYLSGHVGISIFQLEIQHASSHVHSLSYL